VKPQMNADERRWFGFRIGTSLRWVAALAMVGGMLLPATVSAQTGERPPSITVVGEAEVRVQPDMATVSVGVSHVAPTADDAMGMVSTTLTTVLAAVRARGIANSDIQTTGLSLQPIYRNRTPNDETPPQITGYRASNNVSVIVRDLTRASGVLDAALAAGANSIGGISFTLSDTETPRRQALAMATANAHAKAEAIASAAGVAITGVISISEESTTIPSPRLARADFAMSVPAAAPAPPVETGELTVRATVRVSYGI
jgi:uncharacterized protein